MTEPTSARYSGEPVTIDARVAVLDQLAAAYDRHSRAEEDARTKGWSQAAYEHHGAILLLTRMCKEAEAR